MHEVTHVVVEHGELRLSELPFPDGQAVRVSVVAIDSDTRASRTIAEVRRLLTGGVERFDEPTEEMIPVDSWGSVS